jgi:hypothetical protein
LNLCADVNDLAQIGEGKPNHRISNPLSRDRVALDGGVHSSPAFLPRGSERLHDQQMAPEP